MYKYYSRLKISISRNVGVKMMRDFVRISEAVL